MVTKIQIAGKLKFYSKPYGRQWKWRYQTHGHIMDPELQIPKKLKNTKIIDPLNPDSNKSISLTKPKWIPATRHPLLDGLFPPPNVKNHPNYNNRPVKLFDRSSQFHAGLNQACLLTKTKPINGLPQHLTSSNNTDKDHSLVQSYIKQALAFTPTKQVQPRLKIPSDIKFMIAREYATPPSQQMRILLDNLLRLCSMSTSNTQLIIEQAPLVAHVNRAGDDLLIRRNSEFCLIGKKPLKPVVDEAGIKESGDYSFVNMYPVFPTIDLVDEHVYVRGENTFGVARGGHSNLHTIFHVNEDNLNDEANISRMLMFTFGAAIAQSNKLREMNKLDLNDDMTLKKPIVVNGVSVSNSHKFNYVLFQLNTLNLSDNNGVKNICFYDMGNELYFNRPTVDKLPYPTHKNIQRMAMRELEYNPQTFVKLKSIVHYGN